MIPAGADAPGAVSSQPVAAGSVVVGVVVVVGVEVVAAVVDDAVSGGGVAVDPVAPPVVVDDVQPATARLRAQASASLRDRLIKSPCRSSLSTATA